MHVFLVNQKCVEGRQKIALKQENPECERLIYLMFLQRESNFRGHLVPYFNAKKCGTLGQ